MTKDICIPISVAQALAESMDLRQVIIAAWDGENTHIVTYGGSVEDSANAANGGNMVKAALGWPQSLNSESPKVQKLNEQILELQKKIESLEQRSPRSACVHVIEGTEYERGWGPRPDGFVAFMTKDDALEFIRSYNETYNYSETAPNVFTEYKYIGIRECSEDFVCKTEKIGRRHFRKISSLKD